MTGDYTIRTSPQYLQGLFIAMLGVPDLWAVVNCQVCLHELVTDCGLHEHDWTQGLLGERGQGRLFPTQVAPGQPLDQGRCRALVESMRETSASGSEPGAILISEMIPWRLQEDDLHLLAEDLEGAFGAPARVVEFAPLSRDCVDAFEASLTALADVLPADALHGDEESVGVVGYPMDRVAADHTANVRELRRLLGELGLDVSAVWTSGVPVRELARAGGSKRLIALPNGVRAARRIASRSGAEVLETEMPIGLDGTACWLREVGAFTGTADRAGAAADAQLRDLVPRLAPVVSRAFVGRRVALIADPTIGIPLAAYLRELGLEVVEPVHRRRRPASIPGLERDPEDSRARRWDPSAASLARFTEETLDEGQLDLVIGSSWEREILAPYGVPFLEFGFPSMHHRPLVDAPFVGFAGALHLADRLFGALSNGTYERLVREQAGDRVAVGEAT